jgi:MFS family permease
VATYYAYTVTTYASFTTAIWILFVRAQGLSFAEVGALNSVWWAGLVLGEIPTGYLGDRLGRRNSMLLGTAIITAMTVAMAHSTTFLQFAVVYGLWALGQTFRSGSDDAWLYEVLREEGSSGGERAGTSGSDFARVKGRATGIGLAVGAVAAPAGGVLADADFQLPFYATAAVTAVGIPILLTVPESGEGPDSSFDVRTALGVIRRQLARPPLRAFVVYFALLFGVFQMTYIFDQPVAQDAALAVGVPESATKTAVGVVYAGFTAVSAVVSYLTGTIEARLGIRGWFVLAPVVVGGLFLALWVLPVLAVPAFFVARAANTASVTLGNQYLNDRVESVGRATVLSSASMALSLAVIPFELTGGVLADLLSPVRALALFGGVLLVGVGLLWLTSEPVGRESPTEG